MALPGGGARAPPAAPGERGGGGGGREQPVRLLPGVEWSVYRLHVVALGAVRPIEREAFSRDAPSTLRLFAELRAQGAMGIAALPEYWTNYWDELEAVISGPEIQQCQETVRKVLVPDHVMDFILDVVRKTRPKDPGVPPFVKELVGWGAGPSRSARSRRAGRQSA